jgi:peptidyl-prolyl cis-trans isomerase SurA
MPYPLMVSKYPGKAAWHTLITSVFGNAVFSIALLVLCLALPHAAQAQSQNNLMRIAAVVNDDIISVLDLEQRLRLAALSSNLNLDEQTRQRLMPQVLRSLIDERLQLQEATSNSVTATDQEIENEIGNLAQRNNMSPLQLAGLLSSRGIDIQTLRNQYNAQISWAKYIGRRLMRQVEVGEEEIDEELARLTGVADQPQKRVYEIFLGIDNPDESNEIRSNAERLLNQIRNGADFSALARSFSQSGTASAGGDLGWIAPGQLPDELDNVLKSLTPGMVSAPIRTITGFYLLYVTDSQTIGRDPGQAKVDLFQLIQRIPKDSGASAKSDALAALGAAKGSIGSCDALKAFGQGRPNTSVAAAEDIAVSELPTVTQEAIDGLEAGQTTDPLDMGQAVVMITICDRQDAGLTLPSREQLKARLTNERVELLVRRKLRDLRREAFIDIRL